MRASRSLGRRSVTAIRAPSSASASPCAAAWARNSSAPRVAWLSHSVRRPAGDASAGGAEVALSLLEQSRRVDGPLGHVRGGSPLVSPGGLSQRPPRQRQVAELERDPTSHHVRARRLGCPVGLLERIGDVLHRRGLGDGRIHQQIGLDLHKPREGRRDDDRGRRKVRLPGAPRPAHHRRRPPRDECGRPATPYRRHR